MKRRIVQLAGWGGEFALADDGTIWLWTSSGWKEASRGPLPDAPDPVPEPVPPPISPPTVPRGTTPKGGRKP